MTLGPSQTHGPIPLMIKLRWLDTVLGMVRGNSRDSAYFKIEKQTWQRKRQWYTEDDFSKSTP